MKPAVTADSQFRVPEHVHSRQFDQEWVLLDLDHGAYFGLDELGGKIWTHLSEGRTPREVAALLANEYDVDEGVLLADTIALVQDMVQRALLIQ